MNHPSLLVPLSSMNSVLFTQFQNLLIEAKKKIPVFQKHKELLQKVQVQQFESASQLMKKTVAAIEALTQLLKVYREEFVKKVQNACKAREKELDMEQDSIDEFFTGIKVAEELVRLVQEKPIEAVPLLPQIYNRLHVCKKKTLFFVNTFFPSSFCLLITIFLLQIYKSLLK